MVQEVVNNRICLVVLGMHRSGTSALAGTLGLLGVTLPTDLFGPWPSNPKGHFEPYTLVAIHERMLAALHTAWHDIRHIGLASLDSSTAQQFKAELIKALQTSYNDASLFVLKEPRICRFFPLVRSAIESFGALPRVVFCIRNPLEVVNSLRARDGTSLSHGLGLWLRYMLDAELHSRDLPRVFIYFSEFLQDWRTIIGRIEQRLGIVLPGRSTNAANAVDEFVESGLRHHVANIHDLKGQVGDRGWVLPCYEAFVELVRNPDDKAAMEQLDLVRTEFEEPASFFGRGIKEYYSELARLRRVNAEQAEQLEKIKSELEGLRLEHGKRE